MINDKGSHFNTNKNSTFTKKKCLDYNVDTKWEKKQPKEREINRRKTKKNLYFMVMNERLVRKKAKLVYLCNKKLGLFHCQVGKIHTATNAP